MNQKNNFEKAASKALLGGISGFLSGLIDSAINTSSTEDVMNSTSVSAQARRRELISAQILAGLSSNVAAPFEKPEQMASLAVSLAEKLMEKLDEIYDAESKAADAETAKKLADRNSSMDKGLSGAYLTQMQDLSQIKQDQNAQRMLDTTQPNLGNYTNPNLKINTQDPDMDISSTAGAL